MEVEKLPSENENHSDADSNSNSKAIKNQKGETIKNGKQPSKKEKVKKQLDDDDDFSIDDFSYATRKQPAKQTRSTNLKKPTTKKADNKKKIVNSKSSTNSKNIEQEAEIETKNNKDDNLETIIEKQQNQEQESDFKEDDSYKENDTEDSESDFEDESAKKKGGKKSTTKKIISKTTKAGSKKTVKSLDISENIGIGKQTKQTKTQSVVSKVSTGKAYEMIDDYMKTQNRPYSVQLLTDNLKSKLNLAKGGIQKIVDQLVNDKKLVEKTFGKSNKIYIYNQSLFQQMNPEELEKLKEKQDDIKEQHADKLQEKKTLQEQLKDINSEMTNEQIKNEIAKFKEQIQAAKSKLEKFQNGNYEKISDEVMEYINKTKQKMDQEYRKRKRICKEMINALSEQTEKKSLDLLDMIGISYPVDIQI